MYSIRARRIDGAEKLGLPMELFVGDGGDASVPPPR
jgi:hypothetical protein